MLVSDGAAILGLWIEGQKNAPRWLCECAEGDLNVFAEAETWLNMYFTGRNPEAFPPLRPEGTPFQKKVWAILRTIPYGSTVTYGAIASRLAGQTGTGRMSAQAVGRAVGRNPISILIPCHRVVGAHGGLTGYAGGLDRKRALLSLEGSLPAVKAAMAITGKNPP